MLGKVLEEFYKLLGHMGDPANVTGQSWLEGQEEVPEFHA
jgi:hypothetical protein